MVNDYRSPFWVSYAVTGLAVTNLCWSQQPSHGPDSKPVLKRDVSAEDELDRGPIDKSTSIVGSKLVNSDNESFGSIRDLLLDLNSGHVLFAMVEREEAHALIPVPFVGITRTTRGVYRTNLQQQKLLELQPIDQDQTAKPLTRKWSRRIYEQLELGHPPVPGEQADQREAVVSLSSVRNRKVVNKSGDELGHVAGFAIATDDAVLVYAAVADSESQPGLQAIPLAAFVVANTSGDWILDISLDALKERPKFHSPAWPQTIDRGWAEYVHVLYGTPIFEGVQTQVRSDNGQKQK